MEMVQEFLARVWDHWYWLIGTLLMIEPLLDYYWVGFREWADKFVDRKTRTRVAITVSTISILIACFMAFGDEYSAWKKDELVINGTADRPGLVAQTQTITGKWQQQEADINGHDGYKQQISALEHSLGTAQDSVTFLQRQKPQVVVQTKEVPIVIPSGAQILTPDEKARLQRIRIGLSQFLNEGQEISNESIDADFPIPSSKANAWLGRLTQYLHDNLDDSYVTRLNDDSDIPSVSVSGPKVDQSENRQSLWHGLHRRIVRLNQFITELSR